jgi:hypothetical protein
MADAGEFLTRCPDYRRHQMLSGPMLADEEVKNTSTAKMDFVV